MKKIEKGKWVLTKSSGPCICVDCKRDLEHREEAYQYRNGGNSMGRRVCKGCMPKRQALRRAA